MLDFTVCEEFYAVWKAVFLRLNWKISHLALVVMVVTNMRCAVNLKFLWSNQPYFTCLKVQIFLRQNPHSMFETLYHFQIWQHVKSQQSNGYAVKQGKASNKNELLKLKPCLSIYSAIPIFYHRWQVVYCLNISYNIWWLRYIAILYCYDIWLWYVSTMLQYIPITGGEQCDATDWE